MLMHSVIRRRVWSRTDGQLARSRLRLPRRDPLFVFSCPSHHMSLRSHPRSPLQTSTAWVPQATASL